MKASKIEEGDNRLKEAYLFFFICKSKIRTTAQKDHPQQGGRVRKLEQDYQRLDYKDIRAGEPEGEREKEEWWRAGEVNLNVQRRQIQIWLNSLRTFEVKRKRKERKRLKTSSE